MFLVGGMLGLAPISHALNYTSNDLLLVFRKDGYSDVEFDLGPVKAYLGLAPGTKRAVPFDANLVKTNFANSFAGVKFLAVAATGLGAPHPEVWLTDAYTSVPSDFTLSKFSQVRAKISSIGQQATAGTAGNSAPAVLPPSQPNSFSYIASDGNLTPANSLGGLTGFPLEAANPATLDFYQIAISADVPRPDAAFVGSFTLDAAGNLTFSATTDLNADSFADLLLEDADGLVGFWSMNATSLSVAGGFDPSAASDPAWKIVGQGDFNSDGAVDLAFQHADGSLAAWLMEGTKLQTPVLLDPSSSGPDWRLIGVRDVDGDGKPDLIFQHRDGWLAVWFMEGTKMRTTSYLDPANPNDPQWRAVGTGDFNGDGKWELVFQHNDGTLAFWTMDGVKLTSSCVLSPSNADTPVWRVIAVADLDRDGKSDLIFENQRDYSLAAWLMNGCTLTKSTFLDPPFVGGRWSIVGPK
jgi:hypothetical protein